MPYGRWLPVGLDPVGMMAYLWILFTIVASGGQTLRNALQRDLIADLLLGV